MAKSAWNAIHRAPADDYRVNAFNESTMAENSEPIIDARSFFRLLESGEPFLCLTIAGKAIYKKVRAISYEIGSPTEQDRVELELLEDWGRRNRGDTFKITVESFISSDGLYPFRKIIKQEKKTMNFKNLAALVNEKNVTTAEVIYANSLDLAASEKKYTFKVNRKLAEQLGAGDQVILSNDNDRITKIGMVYAVHENSEIDVDAGFDYCWIVDKVDVAQWQDDLRIESELVDAMKRERRRNVAAQAMAAAGFDGLNVDKLLGHDK